MAELSDNLMVVTIVGYLFAMVCFAAQFAFGSQGVVARAAHRVAVPAGAGSAATPPPVDAAPASPVQEPGQDRHAARSRQHELLGRLATGLLLFAVAVHLAATVTRGVAASRLPWGNLYEFILSATLIATAAWLVVMFRYPTLRHLSLFVALLNVVLLGVAGMSPLYTPVEPLVPALDSYWFTIHIAAATTATGVFLVGFVIAVMYLLRHGYDRGRRHFPYALGARIPAADALERLTFRLHAFTFPIWTFAVIAGAVWAEAAWGRYWAWDPKEVWAFITWVVYAAYLHARATPSVKRNVAMWLAILGFLCLMMNLFGVNLLFDSQHSYA